MTSLSANPAAAPRALAQAYFAANCSAMGDFHPPELATPAFPEMEFRHALDGTLTAVESGRWWRGNGVPQRAAEAWLRPLQHTGSMACLLLPQHPAVVQHALERLPVTTGLIVLLHGAADLGVFLALRDFAGPLRSGRLHFAGSPADIERLLHRRDGLEVPSFYIRTTETPTDLLQSSIDTCQTIFAEAHKRRDAAAEVEAKSPPAVMPGLVAVLTRTPGDVWDLGPHVLAAAVLAVLPDTNRPDPVIINTREFDSASHVALRRRLSSAEMVVAADLTRADLLPLLNPASRVVSWVTRPLAASRLKPAETDLVLLADAAFEPSARAAGFTPNQIRVATWPKLGVTPAEAGGGVGTTTPSVVLAADVPPRKDLDCPASLAGLSSVKALWEALVERLIDDPFACGNNPTSWAEACRDAAGVSPDNLDVSLLVHTALHPAYSIGLAKWLVTTAQRVHLAGSGWQQHLASVPANVTFDSAGGPSALATAVVRSAGCIVSPVPYAWDHPAAHLGVAYIAPRASARELLTAIQRAHLPGRRPPQTNAVTLHAALRLAMTS